MSVHPRHPASRPDDPTAARVVRTVVRSIKANRGRMSTATDQGESGIATQPEPENIPDLQNRISAIDLELSSGEMRRRLWRDSARELKHIGLSRLPRGDAPTLGETGVMVSQILGLVADGYDIDQIVEEYEGIVTREEVREALIFASRLTS